MSEDPLPRMLREWGAMVEQRTGLEIRPGERTQGGRPPDGIAGRRPDPSSNGFDHGEPPLYVDLPPSVNGREHHPRPGPSASTTWIRRGSYVALAAAVIAIGIVVNDEGEDSIVVAGGGEDSAEVSPPAGEAVDRVEPIAPTGALPAGADRGAVQVTLQWVGPGDVDLIVSDPNDERLGTAGYVPRRSPSGGTVTDEDAGPCDEAEGVLHFENVIWPEGQAPGGAYNAAAVAESTCEEPVVVRIDARVNGTVVRSDTRVLHPPRPGGVDRQHIVHVKFGFVP